LTFIYGFISFGGLFRLEYFPSPCFCSKDGLSIKELKEQLFATQYSRYPDFKRNVLDKALKEIDELSDLNISYQVIKEGRTYTKFQFSIQLKSDLSERFVVWKNIEDVIGDKRKKASEC